MTNIPTDVRITSTLRDLLGRDVKCGKDKVRFSGNVLFAHYAGKESGSEAVWIWDLPAGISAAAALSMFPAEQVTAAVRQAKVDAALLDNFQEVCNVLVTLLNEKAGGTLFLKEVGVTDAKKGPMIDKMKSLKESIGFAVSVEGYQNGQMLIGCN